MHIDILTYNKPWGCGEGYTKRKRQGTFRFSVFFFGRKAKSKLRFVRLLRKPSHSMSVAALPDGKPPQHRQRFAPAQNFFAKGKDRDHSVLCPFLSLVEISGIEPLTS